MCERERNNAGSDTLIYNHSQTQGHQHTSWSRDRLSGGFIGTLGHHHHNSTIQPTGGGSHDSVNLLHLERLKTYKFRVDYLHTHTHQVGTSFVLLTST